MGTTIRALLIAEAANPEWTSVPLVGWFHARALARRVDAHLVTQVRNQPAFARAGAADERVTFIDSEALARLVWKLGQRLRGGSERGWTTLTALDTFAYPYFEHLVWRSFGERIRAREFDVVHRITPVSPAIPSPLARKCRAAGVPFVLGPLNGGVPWPEGFDAERRREGEWLSSLRAAHRLVPGHRATRKAASAILVGSRRTAEELSRRHRERCVYLPENGIELERFPARTAMPPAPPLRVAFVGRLVPCKGVDMLLEAAAPLVREGRVVIDVVGDGPERARLEEIARQSGTGAGVHFAGWIEHRLLPDRLRAAHVFGFPSVREFGGGAVLEAMALGLVPVVVDYGGPGELVTPRTGFRIPLGSRAAMVAELRRTLEGLVAAPGPLAAMAAAARERVARWFTWDAKAEQVLEVYRWVLGQRTRPDPGMPFPDLPDRAATEATAPAAAR